MKEIGKILAYLAATLFLGALLAPPLYWLGYSAAGWSPLGSLDDFGFQKYFNRAALISAAVLLWPLLRWLRVKGWSDLGVQRDPLRWRHLGAGFFLGAFVVAVMVAGYCYFEMYRVRSEPSWSAIPPLFFSAAVVAMLEETLFRGFLLGLCLRSMRPYPALFAVTALFAALHFLKPDESIQVTDVHWYSGFALLPHSFHQFAEPMMLLAGFSTIFVLGWVLGLARLKTGALWMSIGLHAGIVFTKMSFSKIARRRNTELPWSGTDIQVGLVPLLALAALGGLVTLYLAYEYRRRSALRS